MRMVPVVFDFVEIVIPDTGELRKVMAPQKRYARIADRQFIVGEEYPLVVLETRSRASHSQFFAAVSDAFDNLPEDLDGMAKRLGIKTIPPGGFVDAEHLRKWALCETNHCEVGDFQFDTAKEAMRLATFYRRQDSFAQIIVKGTHVIIKTPASQSAAAMAKAPFEESKRAVLDLLGVMTGTTPAKLKKEAGRSA